MTVKILGIDYNFTKPSSLIIQNLPICPPCIRPSVKTENMFLEDDITHKYVDIIKYNSKLYQHFMKKDNPVTNPFHSTTRSYRLMLQVNIDTLLNNEMAGNTKAIHRNGKPLKSFASQYKSKEGRIRWNMMGKRVDYSARSVITPDPNLSIDELGVPPKYSNEFNNS